MDFQYSEDNGKRIENAMNELINTEIWSTGLYLSLQVYFEDETASNT